VRDAPTRPIRPSSPRPLARRIVGSYVALLLAFATTMGLGLVELRTSAVEAELVRASIAPLQIYVGQALAEQNVLATQLNHAASAKNPADVRAWIDASRRARPTTLEAIRRTALGASRDMGSLLLGAEILRELEPVEEASRDDVDRLGPLFDAIARGDRVAAERAQIELVKREVEVAQHLRAIKAHAETSMERVRDRARAREQRAVLGLFAMSAVTLLVGVALSLYARRALAPLAHLTDRANEVAAGDLAPRAALADPSEIGVLSRTFEAMVDAIRGARAELVKAERLAAVGQMAAKVTHEIRNPLSAIGLNVELLESELEQQGRIDVETRELLVAIQRELGRLSQLSQQYLSLASKPTPHLEPEAIGDFLAELVAFLEPELVRSGVKAELRVDEGLPQVALDEALMRQALHNLLRNAREAMPEGGTIRIGARRAGDDEVEISIEDEGIGIPPGVAETIFDPFVTTKAGGTGLGLAVTREIVEAHAGRIACEPREPRGTRFVIGLPLAIEPSERLRREGRVDQLGMG
jgi:two-component system NtrC family sensor kinase